MGRSSARIEEDLKELRSTILKVSCDSKEGHIPSALSILDILYSIYVLFPELSKQNVLNCDQFVLSKGHAALGFYTVLEKAGLIPSTWKEEYCTFQGDFGGHPDVLKVPHVNASTGSLGHGLPISVGKILANRILQKDSKVICLLGDGELNEGSNWESFLLASHHKMHELIVIIDDNGSTDRALSLGNLESKLLSYDFCVVTIDGHSHAEIINALSLRNLDKTLVVIAKTVKGFGVPDLVSNPAWHHKSPTAAELQSLISSIR